MKISFILPSRNNLKYLKWAYEAIKKNKGRHQVEICIADDASNDGTIEWLRQVSANDSDVRYIRNHGESRVGHTILYDRLVSIAQNDLCIIWHADMYLCPGALDHIENLMYERVHSDHSEGGFDLIPIPKTIVSLTRIEPPLHPPGPEKILMDFGTEPEHFDEQGLLEFVKRQQVLDQVDTTQGIFAPWAFWRDEFLAIGGHDHLFAPQSKEDSDIFNRFALNDTQFIQTWKGLVYHMTCRGSRFNPTLTTPGTNSSEWEAQNIRSSRNFIRKWGSFVRHDEYMKPVIPPKYKIHINITDAEKLSDQCIHLLSILEPRADTISMDGGSFYKKLIQRYIAQEQPNTKFDLASKFVDQDPKDGVSLTIHSTKLTMKDYEMLELLPLVIKDQGKVGVKAKLQNIEIEIFDLTTYQDKLIVVKNEES